MPLALSVRNLARPISQPITIDLLVAILEEVGLGANPAPDYVVPKIGITGRAMQIQRGHASGELASCRRIVPISMERPRSLDHPPDNEIIDLPLSCFRACTLFGPKSCLSKITGVDKAQRWRRCPSSGGG